LAPSPLLRGKLNPSLSLSGLGLPRRTADEVAVMTRDETFKQQWPEQRPGHSVSKDIQP
jgi:hypothetical protein